MLQNVKLLTHSSIRIAKDKVIYIDPFKIDKEYNDADFVFCTHPHFDHFSIDDIKKVISEKTKIITVEETKNDLLSIGFKKKEIITVKPNSRYNIRGMKFETISAYNIEKDFHPKKNNWVGYNININGVLYYISGDTDNTKEAQKVKCDVAFLPVGGTYTMDSDDAADLANRIMPKYVIPTHYGSLVGSREDAKVFESKLNKEIYCEIMI